MFIKNTSKQLESLEEVNFWNDIKEIKSNGYILTTYSTSIVSMRRSLKPILLDVTSFDFVPYYPNTAKNLSRIIENVYGIPFNNPPKNIANKPFLLDENIKPNFENYTEENWKELSKNYNFFGIVVPINWNINLPISSKNKKFAFYIL